jgi:hypothetical protein
MAAKRAAEAASRIRMVARGCEASSACPTGIGKGTSQRGVGVDIKEV